DDGDLVDLFEALEAGARAGAAILADEQRVAAAAALLLLDRLGCLVRLLLAFLHRTGSRRRLLDLERRGGANVHDEAARSTVVEEAVHCVREMRRLREVTEGL